MNDKQEKLRQLLSVLARNDADLAKNVLTYAVCRERVLEMCPYRCQFTGPNRRTKMEEDKP